MPFLPVLAGKLGFAFLASHPIVLLFPLILLMQEGDCQTIELLIGQVPKWTKGADCKSAAIGFQGSNPCLPTIENVLFRS